MRKVKAYGLQMAYEVPEAEKEQAMKLIVYLDHLIKILNYCDEHIDLIYTPFKDNPNITSDQTFKARAALRRYRDQLTENFNVCKRQAFKCVLLMHPFSVDTQFVKLNKSFILAINDIEKQVNRFIDLFANLQAKDFGASIVKGAENIKKEIYQLKQIIEDRMKTHVYNNILARSWVDSVSEELQQKVERRIPLSIQLVEERNKILEKNKI